jgi:uncharacterized protein YlzI (FlbEa/FlbD family)
MRGKSESMFFVRGLTSNGKEVLVNPDQVLYVGPAGLRSAKTALILTHGKRLVVDQDIESVSPCFEDYLRDVIDTRASDDPETRILDDDSDPDEVLS